MSGDTKSIGIAYRDQNLEGSTLTDCTISGGTISGAVISGTISGVGSFTNLTATGNVVFGNASTDTVAFYGAATPQPQQSGAGQASVATTAPVSISATQWGFSTSTQALAVITLQNSIRSALVALGIIAGA